MLFFRNSSSVGSVNYTALLFQGSLLFVYCSVHLFSANLVSHSKSCVVADAFLPPVVPLTRHAMDATETHMYVTGGEDHCLISYRGGLGTSLCIMGYGTQHPRSQKELTKLYNILKFGVNQANIRKDTAIQKLQILLRNVWNAERDGRFFGVPYIP